MPRAASSARGGRAPLPALAALACLSVTGCRGTDPGGGLPASIDPSEERLVFTSTDGAWRIATMAGHGSDPQFISDVEGRNADPHWSPDGAQIMWVREIDGVTKVNVADADGGSRRQMTSDDLMERWPTWLPDGSAISVMFRVGSQWDLRLVAADGSSTTTLFESPEWNEGYGRVSPDGQKIAYVVLQPGASESEPGVSDVWVANVDGSDPQNLTAGIGDERAPRWSPDGAWIAYESNRDSLGATDIWIMRADGSEQRNLSRSLTIDQDAEFSPDGTRIAFSSYRDQAFNVYVVDITGENLVRLTDSTAEQTDPTWSPDGGLIAYTADTDDDRIFETWVMNADGSDARQIRVGVARGWPARWRPR